MKEKKLNKLLNAKTVSLLIASNKGKIVLAILSFLLCMVFALLSLYGPAKEYYLSIRQNDKLNAQLEALQDTNNKLENDIAFLQTEAGIKQRATENLGLIVQGEQVGSVVGLNEYEDNNTKKNNTETKLIYKNIEAPQTWYSNFFDSIFNVKTSS